MAYELGKDWRLHIGDGGGSEVFSALGGEMSFTFSRATAEIDLSTKDDSDYALADYGLQKISFSVEGNVKLPNTALERLLDVSKSTSKRVNIQVKDSSIVKYAGEVAVGNVTIGAPRDGAVSYSFAMTASTAPTTDDMGATA